MSDNRTASMLQRVPVILAVTAASYGLTLQPLGTRERAGAARHAGSGRPQAAGAHRRRAQAIR